MDQLAAMERYFRLLDALYDKISLINDDLGFVLCRLDCVRGRGNVVTLGDCELVTFGHFDEDNLLKAFYVVSGVRECVWSLCRSGFVGRVNVVDTTN